MKKSLAVVAAFSGVMFLAVASGVFADSSTPTVSSTPTSKHSKKKATATPTAQVTVQTTPQVTPSPTATPMPKATSTPTPAPMASSNSMLFSGNGRLYDRVGAPGDLQKAIAAAVKTTGSMKHDKSVFLWLGRISSGSDSDKANAYIRFSLDGTAFVGPKKPSIVLTGTVIDQSGSDCKAGDFVEVAVDFRNIKVDYEGTKLGEVNKGNDIADQAFDILNGHSSYQWVLIAQDQVRDPQESMGMPTFVVKAQDGYSFLQALDAHSHSSASDR